MNAASQRSKLTRVNNVNSTKIEKKESSSVAETQQNLDSPKPEGVDQVLKKESRKETKKKNRKSFDPKKMAKGVASLADNLKNKVKQQLMEEDSAPGSHVETFHEFRNADIRAADLEELNAQHNAGTLAVQAQTLPEIQPETNLVPFEAPPMPVKLEYVLFGHVDPAHFSARFAQCLEGLCDNKTPQNQPVGMVFVELTEMVKSLSGQVSSADIAASIEYVSDELLPSLSRMFSRLENQLEPGKTLNITEGFRQSLSRGLAMFERAWAGLDAVGHIIDPSYQSRSLFSSSGSAGYLENQWKKLDEYAEFRGATIQWHD